MDKPERKDVFASGAAYEPYVGRWSRPVARQFLDWLNVPAGSRWLDVGCGTGAITQTILKLAAPAAITGIDKSEGFVAYAREQVQDDRVSFQTDDAQALPFEAGSYDAVVAGLMLNFVPQPDRAVAEMARVAKAGGVIAVYVWDYLGQMQFMRYFWDAAVALDSDAVDEGRRYPMCRPEPLIKLFQNAGLEHVEVRAIDIPTDFRDFDDYWSPFLGGQGTAPAYTMSLSEERRAALRDLLRSRLPIEADGSIHLTARAWAVRGKASQ